MSTDFKATPKPKEEVTDTDQKVETPPVVEKKTETPTVEETETVSDADLKALARKWETRAKENYAKAKKLDELEEKNKTESEKIADRLNLLEAENKNLKLSSWRASVAVKYNLPEAAMKRLTGETLEELEADAQELKSLLGVTEKSPVKPVKMQGVNSGDTANKTLIKSKEDLIAVLNSQKN